MKIPPWLKDKRVQLGMAAAAGVGLFMFAKRGGSGADGTAGGSEETGLSGNYLQPAQYDSTGPDVYNAISQIGTAWTNDLRDFTDQLGDIQDQLDKLGQAPPVTTPKPTTPAPKPTTKPKPTTNNPIKTTQPVKRAASNTVTVSKFTTASAARGANWTSTLSTIAGKSGTTVAKLLKLNPSIKNPNVIHAGQKIKIK